MKVPPADSKISRARLFLLTLLSLLLAKQEGGIARALALSLPSPFLAHRSTFHLQRSDRGKFSRSEIERGIGKGARNGVRFGAATTIIQIEKSEEGPLFFFG